MNNNSCFIGLKKLRVVLAGFAALLICASNVLAMAKAPDTRDFMVAVNRPNLLHLIDLKEQDVVRSCTLPGSVAPGTVVMSPDNKIAYVLGDHFGRIYGVDIKDCSLVFDTVFSHSNVRVRSLASLAVSPDGKEVYSVHLPTQINHDHYKVMEPRFVVYNASAGIGAKPVRDYPVPRQINIMSAADDGTVYLSGPDVYAMNPATGEYSIAIASRSAERPGFGQPDILTVWPIGKMSDEFIRMYTIAKSPTGKEDLSDAEYWWGYQKVDLRDGTTSVKEFAPLEQVLFTGMHRPGNDNEFYAVLTQLKRHDVEQQKVIHSVDLDRTYYCINFSSDGKTLYLGGTHNDIAVYDAESLQKKGNIVLPGGDMSMATPQIFNAETISLM